MVIFEKADLFYLLMKALNAIRQVFQNFLEISKKFNDMVIFEKADLFCTYNQRKH